MTDKLRLNTTILSWESCIFKIDGDPFEGITSLEVPQKRERKLVYGMRRNGTPIGRTAGKYTPGPIKLSVLRDTASLIKTYLTLKGLGSYGDAEFELAVQYVEPLQLPITVVAASCMIDEESDKQQEGVDELVTEFTISTLGIVANGQRLWSVVRSIG